MPSTPKGYIFRCTNVTQDECFQRMLFGEKPIHAKQLAELLEGDFVYLYNLMSERLFGTFRALGTVQGNIVPEAWGGKFSQQVRVIWKIRRYQLTRLQLKGALNFQKVKTGYYPPVVLTPAEVAAVERTFGKYHVETSWEHDFRFSDEFHPEKFTDDGHYVRSFAEVTIDNWLYHNLIPHGYERRVPVAEPLVCDFLIPLPTKRMGVYVEFWGMNDKPDYLKRKAIKQALYAKYKLPLIELVPEDLDHLDDVMPKKLRQFDPDMTFY
ncbi:MAG: hypothetical protein G01um101431_1042 [Parcubacteria group bacterium Gr01-1014_31]|nr:MAG: hypothetical protein G01um101431_1042 [Parcubacteria group bacterium Gr01-1014_31]